MARAIGKQDAVRRRAALARALKALRRRRGATVAQVAQAVGMPKRSFEHFEAVRGRINVDRVYRVAEALNGDVFAIFVAIALDAPDFAVHCADNKLMSILLDLLGGFEATCGAAIVHLDPATLHSTFALAFQNLAEQARRRAALADGVYPEAPPEDPEAPEGDEDPEARKGSGRPEDPGER